MTVIDSSPTAGKAETLLVINNLSESIELLDAATLQQLALLPMRAQPHEGVVDLDRGLAYVCIPYEDGFYNNYEKASHYLEVVSLADFVHVRSIDLSPHWGPHGIALTPDRSKALITCESNGGELIAVDLASGSVTAAVGVDADGPHWMAMVPDGSKVFTANKEDPFVTVVDIASMTVISHIVTPHGTEQIALSPDGSRVFVASQRSAHLYVIDTATDRIEATVDVPEGPGAIAVTPDGTRVLITYFNFTYWEKPPVLTQGFFQTLDIASLQLGPRIPVGHFPLNVISSADSSTAFVSNFKDHTIFKIDLTSMEVVRTAHVGEGPHGLIYLPAADTKDENA